MILLRWEVGYPGLRGQGAQLVFVELTVLRLMLGEPGVDQPASKPASERIGNDRGERQSELVCHALGAASYVVGQ